MNCFIDGKKCNCRMDGDDCPRDPFRSGDSDDEFEYTATIVQVMDARSTDD